MKIHEYQAKEIFSQFTIPITQEKLCTTIEEVKQAFQEFGKAAIKAQVLVGGRGKAGGIQLARNVEEAEEAANRILGMKIKGLTVDKVLVSEAVDIVSESYVGITTDRNAKSLVIMVSSEGGVEIEEVAKATPKKIAKMVISPEVGLLDFQARNQRLLSKISTDAILKPMLRLLKLIRWLLLLMEILSPLTPR
jgi:succinyl-CoA synthetase beta subunit